LLYEKLKTAASCFVGFDHLAQVFPDIAASLRQVLAYPGDVESDLCLTFTVSHDFAGSVHQHSLKAGGDEVAVTNANREEYVKLYTDYLLHSSVDRQFTPFAAGFRTLFSPWVLDLLDARTSLPPQGASSNHRGGAEHMRVCLSAMQTSWKFVFVASGNST
jgi:hypothetical protein